VINLIKLAGSGSIHQKLPPFGGEIGFDRVWKPVMHAEVDRLASQKADYFITGKKSVIEFPGFAQELAAA
jgi:hypothetical protein